MFLEKNVAACHLFAFGSCSGAGFEFDLVVNFHSVVDDGDDCVFSFFAIRYSLRDSKLGEMAIGPMLFRTVKNTQRTAGCQTV